MPFNDISPSLEVVYHWVHHIVKLDNHHVKPSWLGEMSVPTEKWFMTLMNWYEFTQLSIGILLGIMDFPSRVINHFLIQELGCKVVLNIFNEKHARWIQDVRSSSGLVCQETTVYFWGFNLGLTPQNCSPRSAGGLCFQCCSLSSKSLRKNLFNLPASREGRVVWVSGVISQVVLLYLSKQPLLQETWNPFPWAWPW